MIQEFHPGPPLIFESGAFDRMEEWLPFGNIFLVIGGRSAKELNIEKKVNAASKGDVVTFSGVEPNPSSNTVEKGGRMLGSFDADMVLAVGGGSVMDAAKFMALLADQGGNVMDYISGRNKPGPLHIPVIAVPTTPGTSSEITPFTIVTVKELNNKVGLRDPVLYPSKAVIDPGLTVGLPPDQTVTTGLDILSHAMESYWSKKATPLSMELCLSAVKLVKKHLPEAYRNGESIHDREGLSTASVLAGRSFSNTGTTICHAISYPITVDTGLHHGMACALSLGPTYDILREKGSKGLDDLAQAFGSKSSHLSSDLRQWLAEMDAPDSLNALDEKDWISRIMPTKISNFQSNFKVDLSNEDVKRIIENM